MTKFISLTLAAGLALGAAAPALAENSVGVGVSTFGGNLEFQSRVTPSWGVRGLLMGGIDVDYEEVDGDTDLVGNVTIGGAAVLADYYPTMSGWRVSGGLFLSNSALELVGTADVDGVGTESITAEAEFANSVAPMVTTGYVWDMASGFSLSMDAGLIYTGGIDVTYTAEDPGVQDEVDADADLQATREDASDITLYPYVGVVASFRF